MSEERAMRDNGDKLRYGLIAPEILTALAEPYTMGAKKYEPRNCEKPMSFTELDDALERHLNAFRRGEETAKDSGLCHLHHAIWNLGQMIAHRDRGTLIDDRPVGCKSHDQYWHQPEGFYEYAGKRNIQPAVEISVPDRIITSGPRTSLSDIRGRHKQNDSGTESNEEGL